MRYIAFYLSFILFVTLFVGCGDQTENHSHSGKYYPRDTKTSGVFIDSGVEGIEYTRENGTSAYTDKGGSFYYNYGQSVTFRIGHLVIGEVLGLSTITVQDIVSYKNRELNTSIYSSEVNNRVRTLMTLDEDGIASNGIQIAASTRQAAQNWSTPDYNLSEADFTTAFNSATNNAAPHGVVSKIDAQTHFASSLRCVYSGAYSGKWELPSGSKYGFVGVMIQSQGTIVTLGDGQDLNGDGNASEFLFARGSHDMDTGIYDFNETGEFNTTSGSLVPSAQVISGDGESQGYDKVTGSFTQNGQSGSYTASRVGAGKNTAYRYTGYGYGKSGGLTNAQSNDPILGLFTLDLNRDGNITGLIHDARTNEEPALFGTADFSTGAISITLGNDLGSLHGIINFDTNSSNIALNWSDINDTKVGYIQGLGCQLQDHE